MESEWTERARVRHRETAYMQWMTRWLEDETSHQFRVVPVGTNGNEGTARTLTCLMVRNPTPPDVDYAYSNSTNKVTVSEA